MVRAGNEEVNVPGVHVAEIYERRDQFATFDELKRKDSLDDPVGRKSIPYGRSATEEKEIFHPVTMRLTLLALKSQSMIVISHRSEGRSHDLP